MGSISTNCISCSSMFPRRSASLHWMGTCVQSEITLQPQNHEYIWIFVFTISSREWMVGGAWDCSQDAPLRCTCLFVWADPSSDYKSSLRVCTGVSQLPPPLPQLLGLCCLRVSIFFYMYEVYYPLRGPTFFCFVAMKRIDSRRMRIRGNSLFIMNYYWMKE